MKLVITIDLDAVPGEGDDKVDEVRRIVEKACWPDGSDYASAVYHACMGSSSVLVDRHKNAVGSIKTTRRTTP